MGAERRRTNLRRNKVKLRQRQTTAMSFVAPVRAEMRIVHQNNPLNVHSVTGKQQGYVGVATYAGHKHSRPVEGEMMESNSEYRGMPEDLGSGYSPSIQVTTKPGSGVSTGVRCDPNTHRLWDGRRRRTA